MTALIVVVEGLLDEAVADCLLLATGHTKTNCLGKRGWTYIRNHVAQYNASASVMPFLTLVDLMDTGFTCPGEVCANWLPERKTDMLLRVVVREIESWLLADYAGIAAFLTIPVSFVPADPEKIADPKRELIALARRSKKRTVREALVPLQGSTAQEGPLYTSEMIRFARNQWNIESAREKSRSLDRCLLRLAELKMRNAES